MDQFVLEGKLISVRPVRKVKVDTRSESTETEFPFDFRPKLAEFLTGWKAPNVNFTLPTKFKENHVIEFFFLC